MKRFWRATGAACAVIALSGGLVACGDDDDSAGEGTSGSNGSVTAETKLPTAPKPSGKPVVIGDVTDASVSSTQSAMPKAIDAAADYINNSLGGIKGRPVKVEHCDPKADPAATAACLNKLIDAGAQAIVGNSLIMGACCINIVEKNKVPFFMIPVLPGDYQSKWGIGLGGFNTTVAWATGQWLVNDKKAKNVVELTLDLPTTKSSSARVKESIAAASGGATKLSIISYKFGQADLTGPVNDALSKKPDWVLLSTATPDELKIIAQLTKSGFPADKIITGGESLDYEAFHKPGGEMLKGLYQTTSFKSFDDLSDKEVGTYRKAMDEAGAPARGLWAQWGFASMVMIQRGFEKASALTGEALQKYYADAGPLPIFMDGTLVPVAETPKGHPGIRQLDEQIVQWDGEQLKVVKTVPGFESGS